MRVPASTVTQGVFGITVARNAETTKFHAVLVIGHEFMPAMIECETEDQARELGEKLAMELKPIFAKYNLLEIH